MPRYDRAKRRLGRRSQREKGRWIYVPAEELEAAGFEPERPVYYRLWPKAKGTVLVQFYGEP